MSRRRRVSPALPSHVSFDSGQVAAHRARGGTVESNTFAANLYHRLHSWIQRKHRRQPRPGRSPAHISQLCPHFCWRR